jgi:hypothetical protein
VVWEKFRSLPKFGCEIPGSENLSFWRPDENFTHPIIRGKLAAQIGVAHFGTHCLVCGQLLDDHDQNNPKYSGSSHQLIPSKNN